MIVQTLEALTVTRRTGAEPFHVAGRATDFNVLSFWQWACSDLCGNTLRGLIAEYLVAQALSVSGGHRVEWDAFDVATPDGPKVEVKTSAYAQTWKQKKHSRIVFDIGAKRAWDAASSTTSESRLRSADVYVFAVHAHKDKATLDPLDLTQWHFYVLPTRALEEKCPTKNSIALSSLLDLGATKVEFDGLREAIHVGRTTSGYQSSVHAFPGKVPERVAL
jgi:hypothetical protein